MTNTKMTKRDYFNQILNTYALTEDEQNFIKHEIELLDNRHSENRKPTANQLANDILKDNILDTMEPGKLYTVTDILKATPGLEESSNQKVTALVGQLVKSGVIEKVVDKRRSYFKLV